MSKADQGDPVTKTLYLMRHGQGFHSVEENGHQIRDPKLTKLGEEQCGDRQKAFKKHDQVSLHYRRRTKLQLPAQAKTDCEIDLLLASPMQRTLKTCELTFAPCIQRGLQIIALPLAVEASDDPSDTGSDVDDLREEFPSVNFDHVENNWYVHKGEYATDPAAVIARALKLRRWIRDRPEKAIALVAHGYFIHYLCGEVDETGEQTTPYWQETELRTFVFVDDDEQAMIKETAESAELREAESDSCKTSDPSE
nr:putative phosphatase spac5h10.03 [Quercus suber]